MQGTPKTEKSFGPPLCKSKWCYEYWGVGGEYDDTDSLTLGIVLYIMHMLLSYTYLSKILYPDAQVFSPFVLELTMWQLTTLHCTNYTTYAMPLDFFFIAMNELWMNEWNTPPLASTGEIK